MSGIVDMKIQPVVSFIFSINSGRVPYSTQSSVRFDALLHECKLALFPLMSRKIVGIRNDLYTMVFVGKVEITALITAF
jgi:hypothetical protein